MPDGNILALLAGFMLDLLLGDPPWLPHPVRLIGRLAQWAEPRCRALIKHEYLAGAVFASGISGMVGVGVWLVLWGLQQLHPLVAWVAMRDLAQEAGAVWQALRAQALPTARQRLSRIVGRDTDQLDTPEVVRATVETVAESTIDGILSPLFWAVIGGPPGLWAYKAINTLDSMVGHREEPYTRFGWAAARTDDVANFIPARLGLCCMVIATLLVGGPARRCLRVALRDGSRHPSPNAGIAEAAMAGALGVRLGGKNTYDGVEDVRPFLGEPIHPLQPSCIPQALRLMYTTSALALLIGLGARWLVS
jgi:adenosylcobinamide-phosphate synthase